MENENQPDHAVFKFGMIRDAQSRAPLIIYSDPVIAKQPDPSSDNFVPAVPNQAR